MMKRLYFLVIYFSLALIFLFGFGAKNELEAAVCCNERVYFTTYTCEYDIRDRVYYCDPHQTYENVCDGAICGTWDGYQQHAGTCSAHSSGCYINDQTSRETCDEPEPCTGPGPTPGGNECPGKQVQTCSDPPVLQCKEHCGSPNRWILPLDECRSNPLAYLCRQCECV